MCDYHKYYSINIFQWEYQIGPCPGESIGDHLNMARYILCRLAERLELRISLQPLPVTPLTSGGHLNFSTKQMRNEDGMRYSATYLMIFYTPNQRVNGIWESS